MSEAFVPFSKFPVPENVGFHVIGSMTQGITPHAEEQSLLSHRTTPHLRSLFTLGREAAHYALEQVKAPQAPVLRWKLREPRWPDGYIGSISHSERGPLAYAVSLAARAQDYAGVGIDIEDTTRRLSKGLIRKIAHGPELTWIEDDAPDSSRRAITLFSAKETLFKAFYPFYLKPMRFDQATLVWDAATEAFTAEIHPPDPIPPFSCIVKAAYDDGWVLTSALLPLSLCQYSNIRE